MGQRSCRARARSSSSAGIACVLVAMVCLAWPDRADANGKFPAADQLLIDPQDSSHLVLRTTYGVLVSRDAGVNWDWICESAALYQDYEPGMAIVAGGSIVSALTEGVGRSTPDGCGWSVVHEASIVDVSVEPSDPTRALAIGTDGAIGSRYFASDDAGLSFEAVGGAEGVEMPPGFVAYTVDKAPSDPSRVYASGLLSQGNGVVGALARSLDGGATWDVVSIPRTSELAVPYIGAMDRTDPERVYIRLDTEIPRLVVTTDGGASFVEPPLGFSLGQLRGLAVSPDGQRIAIGTEFAGLYVADTTSFSFDKVSSLAIRCLTWSEDALYVCVNEFLYGDGFIIGRSTDEGATVEPLLSLNCARGPLVCDEGTSVAAECPGQWPALKEQLSIYPCGEGGAGDGGGGVAGAGEGGGSTGAGASPSAEPTNDDGCGCRIAGSRRDTPWHLAVALGIFAAWAQRARRRTGLGCG